MTEQKTTNPKISIIVPIYKVEKYLNRCIQSILNQTFHDFELILVDDGSPDNCPKMCDSWSEKDSRIKVIHKANGGASSARNAGLRIARGEYIAFVDSDDWVHPQMYQTLYSMAVKNYADMAMCGMRTFSGELPQVKKDADQQDTELWKTNDLLNNFFRINGESDTHTVCNKLIKGNLLKGYCFIEGRMNEDVEACYYLASQVKNAAITRKCLYYYYVNRGGVTQSKFTEKKLDLLYIWNEVQEKVQKELPEYQYVCEMNVKRARFTLLSQMRLHGYDKKDKRMQSINKKLKSAVRSDYVSLMRWEMPLSRKILLTLLCI